MTKTNDNSKRILELILRRHEIDHPKPTIKKVISSLIQALIASIALILLCFILISMNHGIIFITLLSFGITTGVALVIGTTNNFCVILARRLI